MKKKCALVALALVGAGYVVLRAQERKTQAEADLWAAANERAADAAPHQA